MNQTPKIGFLPLQREEVRMFNLLKLHKEAQERQRLHFSTLEITPVDEITDSEYETNIMLIEKEGENIIDCKMMLKLYMN
jgi:hypothetical protein